MTLKSGDKAPDFILPNEAGIPIGLSDFKGKKVVIYFYPKDNTPGCTKEACDFRDNFNRLKQYNVEVLGISRDSAKKHNAFKTKYQLPFTLLVDENGDVCKAYDIIDEKSLFGKTFLGIERSTFLIDENGIILAVWRKIKVAGHVDVILAKLAESEEASHS